MKRLKQLAATNDIAHVMNKIQRIAQTGQSDSRRTCYHQVALYLYQNPQTEGLIYLYDQDGMPPYYVAHAILTDMKDKILVDSFRAAQGDRSVYRRPDMEDPYQLVAKIHVKGSTMKQLASADPQDTVTLDVPLLIRLLEEAREDIKSDAELHNLVERIVRVSKIATVLTMQDYPI